jgi:hypothetical protein
MTIASGILPRLRFVPFQMRRSSRLVLVVASMNIEVMDPDRADMPGPWPYR